MGGACREHERDGDEEQLHWICLSALYAGDNTSEGRGRVAPYEAPHANACNDA